MKTFPINSESAGRHGKGSLWCQLFKVDTASQYNVAYLYSVWNELKLKEINNNVPVDWICTVHSIQCCRQRGCPTAVRVGMQTLRRAANQPESPKIAMVYRMNVGTKVVGVSEIKFDNMGFPLKKNRKIIVCIEENWKVKGF